MNLFSPRRLMRAAACVAALLAAAGVQGQLLGGDNTWKESPAGPPPAFDLARLIAVDGPGSATLRFGLDPATVSIGNDRVVRYVVVATSSTGAMVALHEGIRCATGEYKVYARFNRDSGWSPASDSEWRSLFGQMPSRHPLLLARSGVCIDAAPNSSAERIVRHLTAPAAHRYEPQYR